MLLLIRALKRRISYRHDKHLNTHHHHHSRSLWEGQQNEWMLETLKIQFPVKTQFTLNFTRTIDISEKFNRYIFNYLIIVHTTSDVDLKNFTKRAKKNFFIVLRSSLEDYSMYFHRPRFRISLLIVLAHVITHDNIESLCALILTSPARCKWNANHVLKTQKRS